MDSMQLNKYLAHAGVCSRRKAVDLIKAGKVMVNNKVITEPGHVVNPDDVVKVGGKKIKQEHKLYILLNKPKNCITTVSDEKGRRTVIDILKPMIKQRVYPIGRLDYDTTGVLLLTNDGLLAQKLSHPRYEVQKEYLVVLDLPLQAVDAQKIKAGVMLPDGKVKVDNFSFVKNKQRKQVRVALHSGRYRVIRRLFKKLGYNVTSLDRIRFAGLTKRGVPIGKWRFLTKAQVRQLKKM